PGAPLFAASSGGPLGAGGGGGGGGVRGPNPARARGRARARRYDVVWVEKELFPWLPALADLALGRFAKRLVLDYDDAVFHRYDQHPRALVRRVFGRKIDALMRAADLVLVGNSYLGDRARAAGAKRVEHLPTVVDTERYAVPSEAPAPAPTIGWIGTPRTAAYLERVAPVLASVCSASGARVRLIGAGPDALGEIEGVERRPWSAESEVADLQDIDVGIMPLPDEPFERGKCGYKLVQYMACGKPVVASPVGANRDIVEHGGNGFLADGEDEWSNALSQLVLQPALRRRLGAAGRGLVERRYSLESAGERFAGWLHEVAG
ncbi:MAG: glycosyltransferase family 4 protein, partial [Planctomycetota bacterium]